MSSLQQFPEITAQARLLALAQEPSGKTSSEFVQLGEEIRRAGRMAPEGLMARRAVVMLLAVQAGHGPLTEEERANLDEAAPKLEAAHV